MFAILGDVPFQVVGSPEALRDSRRYHYAELRVIQDRPRLQWMADELETIELEMLLHRSLSQPAANLAALLQAAETHLALPLVFGNGAFRGYFVITKIDTVSRQLSASGDPFAITVRVSLCESPTLFDPAASPIPSFSPIAVASGVLPTQSSTSSPAGVSALIGVPQISGATAPSLRAADVPVESIVRSA